MCVINKAQIRKSLSCVFLVPPATEAYFERLKDTYWEKALSNKTPAPTKSMNMDIWVVGTPN